MNKTKCTKSQDPFTVIPIQIWISIFSFLSFTDRRGKKTHHSLSIVSKSANIVTNHEFIWQVRLSLIALHYGYCYIDQAEKANTKPTNQNQQNDEIVDEMTELQRLLQRREMQNHRMNSKPSLFSALAFPLLGTQKFCHEDAVSIFHKLRLRRKFVSGGMKPKQNQNQTSTTLIPENSSSGSTTINAATSTSTVEVFDPDDAPIAWTVFAPNDLYLQSSTTTAGKSFTSPFSIWKRRLIYLHLISTMKCCVCAKEIVSRMSEHDDMRKGMEFYFHRPPIESMIVSTFNNNSNNNSFEEKVPNPVHRTFIKHQLSSASSFLPWSGLRICSGCIEFLNLDFQVFEEEQEREDCAFNNGIAVRRDRNGQEVQQHQQQRESTMMKKKSYKKSLGPVCLLPVDFEILSDVEREQKRLSREPLGYLVSTFGRVKLNDSTSTSIPCDPLGILEFLGVV